jgi:hypothetical protein
VKPIFLYYILKTIYRIYIINYIYCSLALGAMRQKDFVSQFAKSDKYNFHIKLTIKINIFLMLQYNGLSKINRRKFR